MRLGDILSRRGRVQPAEVEAALARRAAEGLRVGEALVAERLVTEQDVIEALAEQWALPFVIEVSDDMLDPSLIADVPVEWARRTSILPVRWKGKPAALLEDPRKIGELDPLAVRLGEPLTPVLAPGAAIRHAIERVYAQRTESAAELMADMEASRSEAVVPTDAAAASSRAEDLLSAAEGAPVTRLVNAILLDAARSNASDIHLEPFEHQLRLRFRLDGRLYDRPSPPKQLKEALISRLKVMAHLDIAERRLPQDGSARVRIGDREMDIRVSTVPSAEGERIVLRLLRRESAARTLEELGMRPAAAAAFRRLLARPQGMVLVTGPTGSGKTTTLYAALRELDTDRMNVMTIEDPIEYQLPSISQIQVHPRIGLTFARCLRHVLRQDPDVILVGETRDAETAEIAVRAALTGHLVFTTLHTNDAASAPQRLIDMGVPPYLLADALAGVLAQRLVRRLCPHCREEALLGAAEAAPWGSAAERLVGRRHFLARGCDRCREGYAGRIGVFELVTIQEEAAEIIRAGARRDALRTCAAATGGLSLLEDGLSRVLEGETSLAELARVIGLPGA